MKNRRTLLFVTGSRADYGILRPLLHELKNSPDFEFSLAVTGSHLEKDFGHTIDEIIQDEFPIAAKVAMKLNCTTSVNIVRSMGLAVSGFADVFEKLKPDLILYLGDRYEILCAAQAALVMGIPTAHFAGGDLTLGAYDDAIRHSLTKMSHLHFVTNAKSEKIVRQLGENQEHIFNVGHLAIDNIVLKDLVTSRDEFFHCLGFSPQTKNMMVTFHPETLDQQNIQVANELIKSLNAFNEKIGIIITLPNAEPASVKFIELFKKFESEQKNVKSFSSLGRKLYLSALLHMDLVVGNSSSGILEVPSFKIPSVNIGLRQQGRIFADSVINCIGVSSDIINAIEVALKMDCQNVVNPYGSSGVAQKIVKHLNGISDFTALLQKQFVCIE